MMMNECSNNNSHSKTITRHLQPSCHHNETLLDCCEDLNKCRKRSRLIGERNNATTSYIYNTIFQLDKQNHKNFNVHSSIRSNNNLENYYNGTNISDINNDVRTVLVNDNSITVTTTIPKNKKHSKSEVQKKHNNRIEKILQQKIWTRNDIIQLLDEPKCANAIIQAKRRKPRNIALCPVCTAGITDDSYPYTIQYMKIPKAGSTTMIQYISDKRHHRMAQTLCTVQQSNNTNNDIRYTMIRHPLERVYSAYNEIDLESNKWKNSPNITYNLHSRSSNDAIHRFLQFLLDYFNGYMDSWDAGMPHHIISSALHLDSIRTDVDGITHNNLLLPDIMGRLEYMNEFMLNLRTNIQKVIAYHQTRSNNNNNNDTMLLINDDPNIIGMDNSNDNVNNNNNNSIIDRIMMALNKKKKKMAENNNNNKTKNKIVVARKSKSSNRDSLLYVGLEWIIETLFQEDYICFGYPYHNNNNTSSYQTSNSVTEEESESYNNITTTNMNTNSNSTSLSIMKKTKRIKYNQMVSKQYFTYQTLQKIQNNYKQTHIQSPLCEEHYKGERFIFTTYNNNSNNINNISHES